MICTTCKAEFCWTCLGPWEPHGSSWYHCNRFNETDAQSARSSQAVSSPRFRVLNLLLLFLTEITVCSRKVSILLQQIYESPEELKNGTQAV